MPSDESGDESAWVRTWTENASAFDRVQSVTLTLSEPRPAPWIAEEAAVSPNTARDHLGRLCDLGIVTTTDAENGRHYYPDPLYTRLRDIRELLEGATKQELAERAADLKAEIAAWEREYDAGSPDALRERAATDGVSPDRAGELARVASDWELARYRLTLLQDALENYDTWSADPSSLTA